MVGVTGFETIVRRGGNIGGVGLIKEFELVGLWMDGVCEIGVGDVGEEDTAVIWDRHEVGDGGIIEIFPVFLSNGYSALL